MARYRLVIEFEAKKLKHAEDVYKVFESVVPHLRAVTKPSIVNFELFTQENPNE